MTLNNSEAQTLTQETKVAPLQTKTSFRKYTKGERRKLLGAIRKLRKEGLSYSKMVARLMADGFTGPGGSALKYPHVNNTALVGGLRVPRTRKAKASTRKAKASTPNVAIGEVDDREALIDLGLQSRLPAAQKVSMIQGLRK